LASCVFVVAVRAQGPDELVLKSAEPLSIQSSYTGPPDAPDARGIDRQPSFLDGYAQKPQSSKEAARSGQQTIPPSQQQPKRILGLMPNYRAVSAGEIPPPPSPKEAFLIATRNSFDYSALLFVGATSAMAEGANKHPQLGKGVAGFGRYYWRGFLAKTDGNYMVEFVMPTIFHQLLRTRSRRLFRAPRLFHFASRDCSQLQRRKRI
jgi:hypothetical protein